MTASQSNRREIHFGSAQRRLDEMLVAEGRDDVESMETFVEGAKGSVREYPASCEYYQKYVEAVENTNPVRAYKWLAEMVAKARSGVLDGDVRFSSLEADRVRERAMRLQE